MEEQMTQLKLNLEIINNTEIEYRGFVIVVSETVTKKRIFRSRSNKDSEVFGVDTFEYPERESRIYKQSSPHSGKLIAKDTYTHEEIKMVTQNWIDIWVYGEKAKYRYVKWDGYDNAMKALADIKAKLK